MACKRLHVLGESVANSLLDELWEACQAKRATFILGASTAHRLSRIASRLPAVPAPFIAMVFICLERVFKMTHMSFGVDVAAMELIAVAFGSEPSRREVASEERAY